MDTDAVRGCAILGANVEFYHAVSVLQAVGVDEDSLYKSVRCDTRAARPVQFEARVGTHEEGHVRCDIIVCQPNLIRPCWCHCHAILVSCCYVVSALS